jgi:putative transcriptional regulator
MKELKPLTNLINARKKFNMVQDDLAKKAKLSRSMLSNIERGYALPSLEVAYRIAKTLNSTIEHIFFDRKAQKMSNSA